MGAVVGREVGRSEGPSSLRIARGVTNGVATRRARSANAIRASSNPTRRTLRESFRHCAWNVRSGLLGYLNGGCARTDGSRSVAEYGARLDGKPREVPRP